MMEFKKRMLEDLQLRGLSETTQKMYIRAVAQLALHYQKPPDQVTDEELCQFFLYLKNVRKLSRAATTIALCGIKFIFHHSLKQEWTTLTFIRPPREEKLPVVLSREEVRNILDCVRLPRYRACLTAIYSCGLRLREGTHLRVTDIDSSRTLIHVRHGKGAKDRYVPLPQSTLGVLRRHWSTHRNPQLIFPAPGRGGIHMAEATESMPKTGFLLDQGGGPINSSLFHKAQKTRLASAPSCAHLSGNCCQRGCSMTNERSILRRPSIFRRDFLFNRAGSTRSGLHSSPVPTHSSRRRPFDSISK